MRSDESLRFLSRTGSRKEELHRHSGWKGKVAVREQKGQNDLVSGFGTDLGWNLHLPSVTSGRFPHLSEL